MASSVFPTVTTGVTVQTATNGGLTGDGSAGDKLSIDLATIPAPGADTQVMFNDAGVLGADSGLTYDKTTNVLTVDGNVLVKGLFSDGLITSGSDRSGMRAVVDLTPVAAPLNYKAASTEINILQNVAQTNQATYMGIYSYGSIDGSADAHAMYGSPTDVENYNTATVGSVFAIPGQVFNYESGTITNAAGLYGLVDNAGTGTITNAWGSYASITNDDVGEITNGVGYWAETPTNGGGGTFTNYFAFYSADLAGSDVAQPYYYWADSQGVYRIREDTVADTASFPQAIPALYNPRFTKYTPGAADYERIIEQWVSNVAVFGAEKGGTGTLRGLKLTGGSLNFASTLVTPASSGTRYLIIDTAGNVTSSASAPSGT